jgi:hypothetical protein
VSESCSGSRVFARKTVTARALLRAKLRVSAPKFPDRKVEARLRRFAKFDHPMGGAWNCSECGTLLVEGNLCPDCNGVLCDGCSKKPHVFPAGARQDSPCPNSVRPVEAEQPDAGEAA